MPDPMAGAEALITVRRNILLADASPAFYG